MERQRRDQKSSRTITRCRLRSFRIQVVVDAEEIRAVPSSVTCQYKQFLETKIKMIFRNGVRKQFGVMSWGTGGCVGGKNGVTSVFDNG